MTEGFSIFSVLQVFVITSIPAVFITGILLISYCNIQHLEERLGVTIGGIPKVLIPSLETKSNLKFHEWLLKRRVLVGLLCILYSLIMLMIHVIK